MPNVADTRVAPASMIISQRWRNDDGIMIWLILRGSKNDSVYTLQILRNAPEYRQPNLRSETKQAIHSIEVKRGLAAKSRPLACLTRRVDGLTDLFSMQRLKSRYFQQW